MGARLGESVGGRGRTCAYQTLKVVSWRFWIAKLGPIALLLLRESGVPLPACSQTSEAQQPAGPASVQDPSETAETPAAEEASEGPEAPKAVDLVEMFGNFRAMNIFRR